MDVEITSTPTVTSMDTSTDVDIDMLNMLKRVFSTAALSHKVFANRTKPVKKSYGQKRVGAKQAKKLEISENG